MLDTVRYWLAVLTIISMPPAVLYWYVIHPFASAWRRLGRLPAYLIVIGLCVAIGYGLWQIRDPLLGVDYGFNPWLSALGLILYLIAIYVELQCRKHLKFYILAGAPELSRDNPGKLLDQGIYSRIRHPRYMSLLFGTAGFTLFVNYRGTYLLLLALLPLIYGLVLLEERELRERFGDAYVEYSQKVPRFIPRRRRP